MIAMNPMPATAAPTTIPFDTLGLEAATLALFTMSAVTDEGNCVGADITDVSWISRIVVVASGSDFWISWLILPDDTPLNRRAVTSVALPFSRVIEYTTSFPAVAKPCTRLPVNTVFMLSTLI